MGGAGRGLARGRGLRALSQGRQGRKEASENAAKKVATIFLMACGMLNEG